MTTLPSLALSVRQPWAFAIIYGGKDIENRTQFSIRHMDLRVGQRIAIHAAKGMTRDEYEDAAEFMGKRGVTCPPAHELARGGIIGSADVCGVVNKSMSPWFMGPKGIILKNPEPCAFIPAVGQLGLFKWSVADASIVPAPAKWMVTAAEPVAQPEGLL
jgi:hypothetical protein